MKNQVSPERRNLKVRYWFKGNVVLNPTRKLRGLQRIVDVTDSSNKYSLQFICSLACGHKLEVKGAPLAGELVFCRECGRDRKCPDACSLTCGHELESYGAPQIGDSVQCRDCRALQRCLDAQDKKRRERKKLKWVTVTIGLSPEFLKELRWIARRDGVSFNSLVVEGLHLAKDASYIPDELMDELYKNHPEQDPRPKPPTGTIQ